MASDLISRQAVLALPRNKVRNLRTYEVVEETINVKDIENLPSAQPERQWIPCSNPPKHHRDVIVRGTEAIGNVTVHKVMQWDVDTWRPTDYAPSIIWEEWSEI